ncbi:MAG: hypothetical protein K2J67_11650 [Lachnospiraceae bacterium]|nr:hypothetical protein [Lachnospiraceae bacterium]
MKKIICDRCGAEIKGSPAHMAVYDESVIVKKYKETLQKNDFCTECIEDIVDFALNKDTCDECVRAMETEAAMLRASDEEDEASPNMEKYKVVMAAYLGEPVRREGCAVDGNEESGRQKEPDSDTTTCIGIDMGQTDGSKTNIQYMISIEEVKETMKAIRRDRRCQSGQH